MGILSGIFRSRDKPADRTAGSAYSFLGGTSSGKYVTERYAMQMTAVYCCVRILSEAVASLPLQFYRYTDDGGKEKAVDHPLYFLLHDEPNSEMTSFMVLAVLSGMSDVSQMEDNISYMKDFSGMSESEKVCLEKARAALNAIPLIPCTTCNYCAKVCPMEIGISGSFTAKNIYTLFGNMDRAKMQENWLVHGHGRKPAVECIKCGKCEQACPQHIQIRDELAEIAVLFGQKGNE